MVSRKVGAEKGQVLVFIVLALVALMGIVALVVDGGAIYNARRIDQNAADASALAGAAKVAAQVKNETNIHWNCSSLSSHNADWADAKTKAIENATGNDFTIDADMSDNNGVEVNCVNDSSNKYIDVHVRITKPVETFLLHVINPTTIVNTVDATVRVKPKIVYAEGAAIVALKDSCVQVPGPSDGGVVFDGTVNVDITNGGIVSNNCCTVNGYSTGVDIDNGSGSWSCAGDITVHPNATPTPGVPLGNLNPPPSGGSTISVDYATLDNQLSAACGTPLTNGSGTFSVNNTLTVTTPLGTPVKYFNLDVKSHGDLTLGDGLYCIYGKLNVDGILRGNNVTIYMPATANIVTIQGIVDLSAPPVGCEYDTPGCKPAVGGLLILYMPDDVGSGQTDQFKISGNPSSNLEGTVLVPKTALTMSGNGTLASCDAAHNRVQLVAESVILNGSGNICINYDSNVTYEQPGFLNLQK